MLEKKKENASRCMNRLTVLYSLFTTLLANEIILYRNTCVVDFVSTDSFLVNLSSHDSTGRTNDNLMIDNSDFVCRVTGMKLRRIKQSDNFQASFLQNYPKLDLGRQ